MSELNFPNNPSDRSTHRDSANHVLYQASTDWGTPLFTGPTMGPATGGLPLYLVGNGGRFNGGKIIGQGKPEIEGAYMVVSNNYNGNT